MKKIGVIGDRQSVQIFAAMDAEVVCATEKAEIRRAIIRLAKAGFAVIFITEQAAALAQETISRYVTAPFPAIIPIPGRRAATGVGLAAIRRNVEKAVGTNIFID